MTPRDTTPESCDPALRVTRVTTFRLKPYARTQVDPNQNLVTLTTLNTPLRDTRVTTFQLSTPARICAPAGHQTKLTTLVTLRRTA